jgi:hypothetical protein
VNYASGASGFFGFFPPCGSCRALALAHGEPRGPEFPPSTATYTTEHPSSSRPWPAGHPPANFVVVLAQPRSGRLGLWRFRQRLTPAPAPRLGPRVLSSTTYTQRTSRTSVHSLETLAGNFRRRSLDQHRPGRVRRGAFSASATPAPAPPLGPSSRSTPTRRPSKGFRPSAIGRAACNFVRRLAEITIRTGEEEGVFGQRYASFRRPPWAGSSTRSQHLHVAPSGSSGGDFSDASGNFVVCLESAPRQDGSFRGIIRGQALRLVRATPLAAPSSAATPTPPALRGPGRLPEPGPPPASFCCPPGAARTRTARATACFGQRLRQLPAPRSGTEFSASTPIRRTSKNTRSRPWDRGRLRQLPSSSGESVQDFGKQWCPSASANDSSGASRSALSSAFNTRNTTSSP